VAWKRLTLADGTPVDVHLDQACFITRYATQKLTSITFASPGNDRLMISVKEMPEEILLSDKL
jgi:hypothetical protein